MYNKHNDYNKNRKNKTADGRTIQLTRDDFPSEAEFRRWKKWSDDDYHEAAKAEDREIKHGLAPEIYPEGQVNGDFLSLQPDVEEQVSQRIILHHALKTLTTSQYVRFMLTIKGYSVSEIARAEHVSHQSVTESIQTARRKLARFLNKL